MLTVIRRAAIYAFAVLSLSLLTSMTPPTAHAQGVCPYSNYCIWVDANYVWPQCWWEYDDGTYWNDWCTSSGNDWLAANAATSYHNNGAPATYDVIRSFPNAWYGGGVLWKAYRGDRSGYVGAAYNDTAESHYWHVG